MTTIDSKSLKNERTKNLLILILLGQLKQARDVNEDDNIDDSDDKSRETSFN